MSKRVCERCAGTGRVESRVQWPWPVFFTVMALLFWTMVGYSLWVHLPGVAIGAAVLALVVSLFSAVAWYDEWEAQSE